MKARALRQARGIVYFRMLRSIGHFYPLEGTNHFGFTPCCCHSSKTEPLVNGLPDPVLGEDLREIVVALSRDLGPICRAHLQHKIGRASRLKEDEQ